MRRLAVVVLAGCASAPTAVPPNPQPVKVEATAAEVAPPHDDWASVTKAPVAATAGTRDAREQAACEDGALAAVAREIAESGGTTDVEQVTTRLRRAGSPYVHPHLTVARGHAPIDETKLHVDGPAACGVAIAPAGPGEEIAVVVRAEKLAELTPFPTRARTGEWLTFEARLRVPARGAKIVVLGPRGQPRNVPTSLEGGVARARFSLDQPGGFTVQLLGDVEGGPKPLLEARVFADVAPTMTEAPAPGEDLGGDDAPSLARMVAAVRTAEGLRPLAPDAELDAFARAHAARMLARKAVAHDLGDGDFKARFEAEATAPARVVGENVAHAQTVALAHRALYASPSHRMNLLRADYTHMGVAITRADDGSVYACETFASRVR